MENWNRIVGKLSRQIKHSVYDSNKSEIFLSKTIIDLDLRVSGISAGKKSFFNLEVNLFASEELDFKSENMKKEIKTKKEMKTKNTDFLLFIIKFIFEGGVI